MQDPVSGRNYEPTIDGIKRWAANELAHGLPLLYAIVGFVTIATIATVGLWFVEFAFAWSTPQWTPILVLGLGVFWGFGGWQHGVEAEKDVEVETGPHLADA